VPLKQLLITGIRGLPAAHGGFETFAENLALHLVRCGWSVSVYCQVSTEKQQLPSESHWNGIKLIHIPVSGENSKASILFDYYSIQHAIKQEGLVLTLGYNTALFNLLLRLKKRRVLINMDGIEWQRDKWSWYEKAWLYLNEKAGCLIGNHLIADHPEIEKHLISKTNLNKVTMIPYGAREIKAVDAHQIKAYQLNPDEYAIVIARPEPENSILEIVKAFSAKPRDKKLLVLGHYNQKNRYQQSVMQAASKEVQFIGAVYNHDILDALRYHSCLYIHGHTVGGTNPSLIEALGAGQPILAHGNRFNRWVAGTGSSYFQTEKECETQLDALFSDPEQLHSMSKSSREQFNKKFRWESILEQYEALLLKWL